MMPKTRKRNRAKHTYHHFSPLEVQAIFDARSRGVKVKDLAGQYQVSRQSIYCAIRAIEDMKATAATREGNLDGAAPPAKRCRSKRIPPEIEQEIADMKRKYPAWGVNYLREHWIKTNHAPLSRASIYRILHDAGLQTRPLVEKEAFQRFEMTHPGQLWQMDVQGELYLEGIGWVYGFAILDDYSRFCTGFRYFTDATLSSGVLILNEAIVKYGVPDKLYTDHGSQFASTGERLNNFELYCAAYGIGITHSKLGRPQGRGKIERFFETVENQFITRVRAMIKDAKEQGQPYTLDHLNRDLDAFLKDEYNARVHGTTKETPAARFFKEPLRIIDPAVDVHKYLERGIDRQVSIDGIISFKGYKIQVSLPPKSTVKVVETIETVRIEQDNMLIRELHKQELSKDIPVRRQSRPDPTPNISPGKELAALEITPASISPANIAKTSLLRDPSEPGVNKMNFHRRKVSPGGSFSWGHRNYTIGKARGGEDVYIRVDDAMLAVHDLDGNLLKKLKIRKQSVKEGTMPLSTINPPVDILGEMPIPVAGQSLVVSHAEHPRKSESIDQHTPDKDGFYRRTVCASGHFRCGGNKYYLGISFSGTNIRIKVTGSSVNVFDEVGDLLRTYTIKTKS